VRLDDLKREPRRKDLLVFGLTLPLMFGIIGYLVRAKLGAERASLVVWGAGGVVSALFALAPPLRKPLYKGWMHAVFPIGWTVSHVLLALLFYVVVTPVGLLRRAVGSDPMTRRFDREAKSYWVEREPAPPLERYFRQY
jgi:hypothetical protein